MLANNLPTFHRWFMAGGDTAAPGILLHGDPVLPAGISAAVARHLNEFDEDSQGNWIAFTPELIQAISEAPTQRGLLGLEDSCRNCPPGSLCGRRKVLAALAARGNVVLDGPLAVEACVPFVNVFRVSLGPAPGTGPTFHLVICQELFHERSLPAIIGDTYLEWMAAREMAETV